MTTSPTIQMILFMTFPLAWWCAVAPRLGDTPEGAQGLLGIPPGTRMRVPACRHPVVALLVHAAQDVDQRLGPLDEVDAGAACLFHDGRDR